MYLYYIGHYYIVKLFWNGSALRGGRITVDTSLKENINRRGVKELGLILWRFLL
jgi:hypothetical protein